MDKNITIIPEGVLEFCCSWFFTFMPNFLKQNIDEQEILLIEVSI